MSGMTTALSPVLLGEVLTHRRLSAMREDYARVIRESYPEFADKVVSLGEINMPLFSGDEAMEQCYDAIKAGITELLLSEKD